jgi:hypothetical protein
MEVIDAGMALADLTIEAPGLPIDLELDRTGVGRSSVEKEWDGRPLNEGWSTEERCGPREVVGNGIGYPSAPGRLDMVGLRKSV